MNSIHKDGFYLSDDHHLVQVLDGRESVYFARLEKFVPLGSSATQGITMHDPSPISEAKADEKRRHERASYLWAKDGRKTRTVEPYMERAQ